MKYYISYLFAFFFLIACSDDPDDSVSECQDCQVRTTSNEVVVCGVSNDEEVLNITDLGEICDEDERTALKQQHNSVMQNQPPSLCAEHYTITTRVVCN